MVKTVELLKKNVYICTRSNKKKLQLQRHSGLADFGQPLKKTRNFSLSLYWDYGFYADSDDDDRSLNLQ